MVTIASLVNGKKKKTEEMKWEIGRSRLIGPPS